MFLTFFFISPSSALFEALKPPLLERSHCSRGCNLIRFLCKHTRKGNFILSTTFFFVFCWLSIVPASYVKTFVSRDDEDEKIKLLFLICIMKTFRMEMSRFPLFGVVPSSPGHISPEIIFISNFNKIYNRETSTKPTSSRVAYENYVIQIAPLILALPNALAQTPRRPRSPKIKMKWRNMSPNKRREENLLTIRLERGLSRNQINKSFCCYPSHVSFHPLHDGEVYDFKWYKVGTNNCAYDII